jgi:hypothetical protein
VWVHTNILKKQAASTFRAEVCVTWIKINAKQAGTAFKQGPENTVFIETLVNAIQ